VRKLREERMRKLAESNAAEELAKQKAPAAPTAEETVVEVAGVGWAAGALWAPPSHCPLASNAARSQSLLFVASGGFVTAEASIGWDIDSTRACASRSCLCLCCFFASSAACLASDACVCVCVRVLRGCTVHSCLVP
jgi:hypothetical protein